MIARPRVSAASPACGGARVASKIPPRLESRDIEPLYGMSLPDDSRRTSDSTPNFDWLHQHDRGAADEGGPLVPPDSSVEMLPPELEPAPAAAADEPMFEAGPVGAGENDENRPAADETSAAVSGGPEEGGASEGEEDQTDNVLVDSPDDQTSGIPSAAAADEQISDAPTKVSLTNPAAPSTMPGEPSTSRPPPTAAGPQPARGGGNLLLILLASYASAATIALVYLITSMNSVDQHALESLPDVEPLEPGEVALVPIDAGMPNGHTLEIGESRRFGNILVEPLRVVEEPIEFVHFSGSGQTRKAATPPVFKLYVRFTNVSDDQAIAPLDRNLVFSQVFHDDGRLQTNQVVLPAEKQESAEIAYLYSHPLTSEWDLAEQNIDTVLAPGESVEMYLPAEPAARDRLSGDVLWRVHFRKGYSPKGYGVTTVIEVAFNTNEVKRSAAG